MERSHLASPADLPCGLVCHGADTKTAGCPEKMSRPQKRRRRAERCAVRSALVLTGNLKREFHVGQIDGPFTAGGSSCLLESKLCQLESKLDQVLVLLTGAWQPYHDVCSDADLISPPGLDQISAVLTYLRPDAPEFVPSLGTVISDTVENGGSEVTEKGSKQEAPDIVHSFEARITALEGGMEELLASDGPKVQEAWRKSIDNVQEHVDLEVARLRVAMDADYSLCAKKLKELELNLECLQVDQDSQHSAASSSTHIERDVKINLDIDLGALTPMQRGLFKHIGGTLNTFAADRRRKHLQELKQNLSGQKAGQMKDQQAQVLNLLEQLMDSS